MSLLATAILVALSGCNDKRSSAESLAEARYQAERGNYAQAAILAAEIPSGDASWAEAQLLLGMIRSDQHGPASALPIYESIPRDGSPASVQAARAIADFHFRNGALAQAADEIEYLLRHRPDDVGAHSFLANILINCGQRNAGEMHLLRAMRARKLTVEDLVRLSAPDRTLEQRDYLLRCAAGAPDDPFVNLGLAVEELADQNAADTRLRLMQVIEKRPDLAEAQGLLGELVLDGDLTELEAWNAQLPASVHDHFAIWYVRGLWARRSDHPEIAARCFWEAIRQRPTHYRAMYQLGQVLVSLEPAASEAFSRRAAQLKEYSDLMEKNLIQHGKDLTRLQRMITLLTEMGRDWEAWAWGQVARDFLGPTLWQTRLDRQLAHVRAPDSPRFQVEKDLSRIYDLSHYPGFAGMSSTRTSETLLEVAQARPTRVRFNDQAQSLGIDFTYFQGPDRQSHGVRIFESTGGGVGVFDFDRDGWPDLFLTQGKDWPRGSSTPDASSMHRDQLYQNSGTGFRNVTELAWLLADEGYGQGCSAGDFDNDGFSDLYVANIGLNQLIRNNGDGTFSDVTRDAGISGSAWTTSCLILDLNADGYPDLYDVNYLQGDRIYSIECNASRCSVRNYEGAPDQVQLSRGDGTFVTVPDATPLPTGNDSIGKGLGIVALFINAERLPSLFIANDQVPNFFLRPAGDGRYTDVALLAGIAVNRNGHTTASMGVASGDLNHDRRIDLLVTNFEGEANTLFLQQEGGIFSDAIVGTGLMAPGIPYVGWGTQFLDADNDGELDVVVANGHIADFGDPQIEYRMPLQLFVNLGRGRFRHEGPADAGALFDHRLFGRSLATIDWNCDGQVDFVLSNIESPVIVPTNATEHAGHWLNVRLHARDSARDAVGAVVEIQQGAKTHWQQLTAGDGYQATNERHLHFGLGTGEPIDQITIHWPSGATSSFASPPVDRTVEIVEGTSIATLWNQGQVESWPPRQ